MAFPTFEMIQGWYPTNWTVDQVAMAVKCNRLTNDQYKTITTFDYPATSAAAPKSEATTPAPKSESASQSVTQSESTSASVAQSASSSASASNSASESKQADGGPVA